MKSTINQVCKGLFLSLVTSCTLFVQEAKAWTGSTPANGQSYYLYNLYQEKFLSYGNSWGTQVSLDNNKPMLCTVNKNGTKWTINTHYSLSSQSYNASVNNYMIVVDGVPFVNSNYGTSDTNFTTRTPQSFTISSSDDRGYYPYPNFYKFSQHLLLRCHFEFVVLNLEEVLFDLFFHLHSHPLN